MSDEEIPGLRKLTPEEEKIVDFRLGIEKIPLYLEIKFLNELKELAKKQNINYKSYIRRVLNKHLYDLKRGN